MESSGIPAPANNTGGISPAKVFLIVLATILVSLGGSYWFLKTYVFAREFQPVELSGKEQETLDGKLLKLGFEPESRRAQAFRPSTKEFDAKGALKPEPYSEAGGRREVSFNEREMNALLAHNTDLARRLAIDLAENLVSVKFLVPMEPDMPVLGGKTLRLNAGVAIAYRDGKPSVALKGVSIMGVPLPNAWLGGLKNVDLVREFGGGPGFWQSFSSGVEDIRVEEGFVKVTLRE